MRITEEFKSALIDEKLARQTEAFDQKLAHQTQELKDFIDRKVESFSSCWWVGVEDAFRRFVEEVTAQWGGTVTKWRRKLTMTDEFGTVSKHPYEVDMVIANGNIILVEMKSHCDLDDVELFCMNAEQYANVEKPAQPVDKVLLTFDISEPALAEAEKTGIRVILPD
jgi:hypothetical protein